MLLVDIGQSSSDLGSVVEQIGSTLGDSDFDKSLLYMFERYIDLNGLTIGRWKIYQGNGNHLFIIDTNRDGYYRMDKTCRQKQIIAMPTRELATYRHAKGYRQNVRSIY